MPGFIRTGRKLKVSKASLALMQRRSAVKRAGGRVRNLKNMVKRMIKGASETKYVANTYQTYNTPFPSINWSAPVNLANVANYYPALPVLTQGVGDFQRIGAKVLPTRCYTDLTVGYTATDISCNEIVVVIYYGTTKAGKTWQANTPIQSAGDLLDNGDGTTGIWSGAKADLLYPINKHMNNAKRITFRLGKTAGVLNDFGDTGAAPGKPNGAYATSNGGSFKTVRLNFKPPKALQYDQTAHTMPSNYAPWFAISWCRVDNKATDPTNAAETAAVNVSHINHMYFKDV